MMNFIITHTRDSRCECILRPHVKLYVCAVYVTQRERRRAQGASQADGFYPLCSTVCTFTTLNSYTKQN